MVRVTEKGEMRPLGAQKLRSVDVEKWVKYSNGTSARYSRWVAVGGGRGGGGGGGGEFDNRAKNNDAITAIYPRWGKVNNEERENGIIVLDIPEVVMLINCKIKTNLPLW